MGDTCEILVQAFADWSRKYPTDVILNEEESSICAGEFVKLEERAKLLKPEQ